MRGKRDGEVKKSAAKPTVKYPDAFIQAVFDYLAEYESREPNFVHDFINVRFHGDRFFHGLKTNLMPRYKIVVVTKEPKIIEKDIIYVMLDNTLLNYTVRDIKGDIVSGGFNSGEIPPQYSLCLLPTEASLSTKTLETGIIYYFPSTAGITYIVRGMKEPASLNKESFECSNPLDESMVESCKSDMIRAIARNKHAPYLKEDFNDETKLKRVLAMMLPLTTKRGHTNQGEILADRNIELIFKTNADMKPVLDAYSKAVNDMEFDLSSSNGAYIHDVVHSFFEPIRQSPQWTLYWANACELLAKPDTWNGEGKIERSFEARKHKFQEMLAGAIILLLDLNLKNYPDIQQIPIGKQKIIIGILPFFSDEIEPKMAIRKYREKISEATIGSINTQDIINYIQRGDEKNALCHILDDNDPKKSKIAKHLIRQYGIVSEPWLLKHSEYFSLKERGQQCLYLTLLEQLTKLRDVKAGPFTELHQRCLNLYAKGLLDFVYNQHKSSKNPSRVKLTKLNVTTFAAVKRLVETAIACLSTKVQKEKKFLRLKTECEAILKQEEKKHPTPRQPIEKNSSTESENIRTRLKQLTEMARTASLTSVKVFSISEPTVPEGKTSARKGDNAPAEGSPRIKESNEPHREVNQRIIPRGGRAPTPGRDLTLKSYADAIGNVAPSSTLVTRELMKEKEERKLRRHSLHHSDLARTQARPKAISPEEKAQGTSKPASAATDPTLVNEERITRYSRSKEFFKNLEARNQESTRADARKQYSSDSASERMKRSVSHQNLTAIQPLPSPEKEAIVSTPPKFNQNLENLPRNVTPPSSGSSSASPGPRYNLFMGIIKKKSSEEVHKHSVAARDEDSPTGGRPVQLEKTSPHLSRHPTPEMRDPAAPIQAQPTTPPSQKQSMLSRFLLKRSNASMNLGKATEGNVIERNPPSGP